MTATHAYNAAEIAPAAPVARPVPVSREEYMAATCPLCFGSLWQRISGLFCPRCKGWLVEEIHDGHPAFSLWQGRT